MFYDLNFWLIIVLIVTGTFVGFINSVSAGGTAISISLYIFLGLPLPIVNATNRVGVLVQSLASAIAYKTEKTLNVKATLLLGLPTMAGAFLGSIMAMFINTAVFEYALAVALIFMLFFIFFNPEQLKTGRTHKHKKMTALEFIVYFAIGVFGGFIQVGTGFFLMAAGVMISGYSLIHSNALKVSIMFLYTAVSLAVFYKGGLICWEYGLLHSLGEGIGAILGAKLVVKKGIGFIKWVTVFIIIITAAQLFGFFEFKDLFSSLLKK